MQNHLWMALALIMLTPTGALAAESAEGKSDKWLLAFRMRDWKTTHLHDAEQINKHEQALKQLGCEIRKSEHNGHTDIACRTVYWKSLALDSMEQLKSWEDWLTQLGFDTIHGRPVPADPSNRQGKEIVQYRAPQWLVQHIHQAAEVGQTNTLFRALGCEVTTAQHNGHSDLRMRCPEWREIELPTHDAAHSWQEYLKKAGFETKHTH